MAWDEPLREVKPPSSLLLTKLSRRKANLPGRYYFIFHFIFIFIIAQPSSLQPHSGAARTPILPGKTKPRGLCPPSLTPKLLCQGSSLAGRLGPTAMHVSGPSSSERSLAGELTSFSSSSWEFSLHQPWTWSSLGPTCVPGSWRFSGAGVTAQ